jgi:hypothetical protein
VNNVRAALEHSRFNLLDALCYVDDLVEGVVAYRIRADRMLGWRPHTSLRDGLSKTIVHARVAARSSSSRITS